MTREPGPGRDLEPAVAAAAERQATTTSTRSRNATGLAAAVSAASPAKRHGCRAWSAQSASSASAAPSANGKAAERTIPPRRPQTYGSTSGRAGPTRADEDGEGKRRRRDGRDREQPDPERRRERVVQQAVRDEAVAARVPEVVPEGEPVVEEHRPLVDVRGEVGSRRSGPDEHRRERRGDARREDRLTLEGCGPGHRQRRYRARAITRRFTYPLVRPENRVRERAGGGHVARAVVDEQRDRDPDEERFACREARRPGREDDERGDRDAEHHRLEMVRGDARRRRCAPGARGPRRARPARVRNACVTWLRPPVAASRPTMAASATTPPSAARSARLTVTAVPVMRTASVANAASSTTIPPPSAPARLQPDRHDREGGDRQDRAWPEQVRRLQRHGQEHGLGQVPRPVEAAAAVGVRADRGERGRPRARQRRRRGTRGRARRAPTAAPCAGPRRRAPRPIVPAASRQHDRVGPGDADRREEQRGREHGRRREDARAPQVFGPVAEGEQRAAEHRGDEDQRRPEPDVVRARHPPVELRERGGRIAVGAPADPRTLAPLERDCGRSDVRDRDEPADARRARR